ncbi:MAG: hypothetical protein AAGM38_12555 [Pseudomonadota bacterium]
MTNLDTNRSREISALRASKTVGRGLVAAAALGAIMSLGAASAPAAAASLIPEGVILETWKGGWRRGGSSAAPECLRHFNAVYPTARIQIIDTDEEARWAPGRLRHREYRYGCTVLVKPS